MGKIGAGPGRSGRVVNDGDRAVSGHRHRVGADVGIPSVHAGAGRRATIRDRRARWRGGGRA